MAGAANKTSGMTAPFRKGVLTALLTDARSPALECAMEPKIPFVDWAKHEMKRVTITTPIPSVPNLPRTAWNYLVMAVLLLPSLVWISIDRRVWPWDQAWYGEVSVDLWFWLGHSWRRWVGEMADGLPFQAPGIVWLGQFFIPLRGIFASTETALLLSILLTQFAMLVILFKMGQRMAPQSRLIPLAGLLFVSGSQLFVGLSHQFFVEPLQALAVAWCFYIALRAPDWPKPRIAVHLTSALVLGLLAKASTPFYCLVPCIYCGSVLVRKPWDLNFVAEWRSRSSRMLVFVFGILGILGGFWYLHNLHRVWQHIHDSSFGDVALYYGWRDSVFHKLITWSRCLNESFLAPYLSWGLVAAILIGGGRAIYRRTNVALEDRLPRIHPVAVLSAIQVGLLLFVLSLNIAVDPRYMYALLPCVAIFLMQVCVFVPRKLLLALMVLAFAQWILINEPSFGLAGHLADWAQWLLPVQTNSSQYEELSRVVRLTSDAEEHYNIVGVEYWWLNANSAEFFSAKERLRTGAHSYYTSLGYLQKDPNAAMRRIEDVRAQYLITLGEQYQTTPPDFPRPPDFLNIVSLPVLERVRRDSRFTQVAFTSKNGLLLFKFTSSSHVSELRPSVPTDTVEPVLTHLTSAP